MANLNAPWLVAVWPGMGHVALNAGYYLMAKLGMTALGEFSSSELFDVNHVDIRDGLIRPITLPRNQLFAWKDPSGRHDILVFVGEEQPPIGKHAFCSRLVDKALELGVKRVFTFAAMATQMHPTHDSRVFGAATDGEGVRQLQQLELELLIEGQISGLNGVLLGVAAEAGLPGICLLGEIPHLFVQVGFPRAAMRVLQTFGTMAGIELDYDELDQQARHTEEKLGQILARLQHVTREEVREDDVVSLGPETGVRLGVDGEQRIEQLFHDASHDRTRAYELKRLLDDLGVFETYEDRFLDLFRPAEDESSQEPES